MTNNELQRVLILARAAPAVRLYRDGGSSWREIIRRAPKTCNPLGLSERQLMRIYEGPEKYDFDILRRYAKTKAVK